MCQPPCASVTSAAPRPPRNWARMAANAAPLGGLGDWMFDSNSLTRHLSHLSMSSAATLDFTELQRAALEEAYQLHGKKLAERKAVLVPDGAGFKVGNVGARHLHPARASPCKNRLPPAGC